MREAWVRLCGTYQSKGGVIAKPEVRKARSLHVRPRAYRVKAKPYWSPGTERVGGTLLRDTPSATPAGQPFR